MKKNPLIISLALFICVTSLNAQDKKVKTGWNFGALPCISYDADLGFQYGALANIYYYGDGSIYPEYLHSLYVEASTTTRKNTVLRISYDSKYLIPNHGVAIDVTYMPDPACSFYGFDGYNSVVNKDWVTTGDADYQSRVFYNYKRSLFRAVADIDGQIYGNWKWNLGTGVFKYACDTINTPYFNKKRDVTDEKYLPYVSGGLYQRYIDWGIINPEEQYGGWHPYIHAGITYDSRDFRGNPSKGIYTDAFITYNAAFGNQKEYNNLMLNFDFRQYITIIRNRLTFAYRLSTQNLLWGESPAYTQSVQNCLIYKRAMYDVVGGSNSVRGLLRNRVVGEGFAFANLEFRARLVNFDIGKQHFYIGLNPFFDLGMVTQPYKFDETEITNAIAANNIAKGLDDKVEDYFDFTANPYGLHMSAGCGLKIAMNENFVLSVDWATPIDKRDNYKVSNLYIKVGYLF